MCLATIFVKMFGMQLFIKNSDVKESLIQTEAIDMLSPLRDGIITGNLLHKYYEPVPISIRIGNEVTCCVITSGC